MCDGYEKGPRIHNMPGNLRRQGSEEARPPILHTDLPSTPFSVQSGKERSVHGKDHVTRKPGAFCADLLVSGRLNPLKHTYLTLK